MRNTIIFFTLLFSSLSCQAIDVYEYNQLLKNRTCPQCDLSGAPLTMVNLSHADLTGADLTEANLMYADLTGAKMQGAIMLKANMRGAKLDPQARKMAIEQHAILDK